MNDTNNAAAKSETVNAMRRASREVWATRAEQLVLGLEPRPFETVPHALWRAGFAYVERDLAWQAGPFAGEPSSLRW